MNDTEIFWSGVGWGLIITLLAAWITPDRGYPIEFNTAQEMCKINGGVIHWEMGGFYPLNNYNFYCKDGAKFSTFIDWLELEHELKE